MNHIAIANQIRAYAVLARIEGMKAENQYRTSIGESIAYGEEAFSIAETELEILGREVLEWGWQQ